MQVDYRNYNNPKVVFPAVAPPGASAGVVFAMHAIERSASLDPVRGLFTFQPSEMAKPVVVLFLAYFLQTRLHAMDDWKGTILRAVMPPLVFIAADSEGAGSGHWRWSAASVMMLMLYLAGAQRRISSLRSQLRSAAPVLYFMLFFVKWRRARMMACVMNPDADPKGARDFTSCNR